jgi:hypothetical protein
MKSARAFLAELESSAFAALSPAFYLEDLGTLDGFLA